MIHYRPTDGEVQTTKIEYKPSTCFIMTQLAEPIPPLIKKIRKALTDILKQHHIDTVDAKSQVTGRDFLLKIWHQILSVPLGIAIIDKGMSSRTFGNVFYELGMMHAYGKETLIIKTPKTDIPSDFVRTEYVEFDKNFEKQLAMFLKTYLGLAEHYLMMADQMENNPLLAIDYLRRSYLISGDKNLRKQAKEIIESAGLEQRAKNSVEMLHASF